MICVICQDQEFDFNYYLKFLLDRNLFVGKLVPSVLEIGMTLLSKGFKVRVDSLSPVFFCHLPAMIPRVICGCRDWESNLDRSHMR